MSEGARIRPTVSDDADDILAMTASCQGEDDSLFGAAAARRAVAGLIEDERRGPLRVVEQKGRLVGYLALMFGYSLEYHRRDAFIDEPHLAHAAAAAGAG